MRSISSVPTMSSCMRRSDFCRATLARYTDKGVTGQSCVFLRDLWQLGWYSILSWYGVLWLTKSRKITISTFPRKESIFMCHTWVTWDPGFCGFSKRPVWFSRCCHQVRGIIVMQNSVDGAIVIVNWWKLKLRIRKDLVLRAICDFSLQFYFNLY